VRSIIIVILVRQGYVLSPFLFLLVMDWILKKAADGDTNGIEWKESERFADLDFVDDHCVHGILLERYD